MECDKIYKKHNHIIYQVLKMLKKEKTLDLTVKGWSSEYWKYFSQMKYNMPCIRLGTCLRCTPPLTLLQLRYAPANRHKKITMTKKNIWKLKVVVIYIQNWYRCLALWSATTPEAMPYEKPQNWRWKTFANSLLLEQSLIFRCLLLSVVALQNEILLFLIKGKLNFPESSAWW